MLDSSRLPLPDPPSAQGTVATPSRLGERGLVADFAVVALATTLGATADAESQLSQLRNELFLVRRHSRSLLCLLTQALSSRPELVPAIRDNYHTVTMIAKSARSVRALCPTTTCFQRQMS